MTINIASETMRGSCCCTIIAQTVNGPQTLPVAEGKLRRHLARRRPAGTRWRATGTNSYSLTI